MGGVRCPDRVRPARGGWPIRAFEAAIAPEEGSRSRSTPSPQPSDRPTAPCRRPRRRADADRSARPDGRRVRTAHRARSCDPASRPPRTPPCTDPPRAASRPTRCASSSAPLRRPAPPVVGSGGLGQTSPDNRRWARRSSPITCDERSVRRRPRGPVGSHSTSPACSGSPIAASTTVLAQADTVERPPQPNDFAPLPAATVTTADGSHLASCCPTRACRVCWATRSCSTTRCGPPRRCSESWRRSGGSSRCPASSPTEPRPSRGRRADACRAAPRDLGAARPPPLRGPLPAAHTGGELRRGRQPDAGRRGDRPVDRTVPTRLRRCDPGSAPQRGRLSLDARRSRARSRHGSTATCSTPRQATTSPTPSRGVVGTTRSTPSPARSSETCCPTCSRSSC